MSKSLQEELDELHAEWEKFLDELFRNRLFRAILEGANRAATWMLKKLGRRP